MAAWSSQIVPHLLKAQHSLRNDLGTDVMYADRQTYNINLELLALIAMVMKAVQDLHPTVATDAAWQQRLNVAVDTGPGGDRSGWPGWVLLQVPPEDLARYGATETDSVDVLRAKIDAYNNG
ncbi:hypothetical protein ABZ949_02265 [Micromonospora tulbaghiae]|uniref:hypothetical protein n=1 Tax=Micromonospora tulbaghiae TaxID=479978 RepID=UPI003408D7DF